MARTIRRWASAFGILTLVVLAPVAAAGAGDWWEARSRAQGQPQSTATHVVSGQVFLLSFFWGGGPFGTATLEFYDPMTGALVHSASIFATEDISSVAWVECRTHFPHSEPGFNLESVPLYSLVAPGVLSLGPGALGGSGRYLTSFCHEANVPPEEDSLYGRRFIDLTGWYNVGTARVPSLFHLDVHVRDFS